MRRAIRSTIVLVVALGALGGFGLGVGCSRDARPAVQSAPPPDEPPPPLPPASGTPIGYLVDDTRLKLNDDQLAKLRVIDGDLSAKLTNIDLIVRNTGSGSEPQDKGDSRGGIGFRGWGERDGQEGGKSTTPQRVETPTVGAAPAQPGPTAAERAAVIKRAAEVRAYDVRQAIAHALAVLDPAQQRIARQVLRDRGVDPETGQFEATGEPGKVAPGSGSGSGSGRGRGSN